MGSDEDEDHPNIVYKLIELTPKAGGAQGSAQFDAKGTLTVAGVTRTNTMPVTIEKTGDNKAKATGTTTVKMTDFGITPPARPSASVSSRPVMT